MINNKIFRLSISIVLYLVLILNPLCVHAAAMKLEDLLKLDIVDLGKIKVTVASKREESVSDAPGIITIVTARDIEKYGANNLADVLDRTTSIQAIGSHFYSNSISMRGQMVSHSNNDILFLINGRPYRTSWNGGTPERLLLGFPIDTIKRIEIIRGPGSVLYGTEAMTGVINIITKSAAEVTQSKAKVSYGTFNTRSLNVSTSQHSPYLDMTGGFKLLKTDGWTYTATDEAGVTDTVDRGQQDLGGMLTLTSGNARLDMLYTHTKLENIIGGPPLWPAGFHEIENLLLDLGHRLPLHNGWQWENHLTYNKFDFWFVDTPPMTNNRDSRDTLFESTLSGKLREDLTLLLGGTYENISGTISPTQDYDSHRASVYVQSDYLIRKNIKLTAGFQYNKVADTDGDFSPRLGLVDNFSKNWGMKLLYGQAFRSAVSTERFLITPGVLGNPSLDPEKIATTELQLFYTDNTAFAALTFFHSAMRDVIDRVQMGGTGPLYFVNVKKVNSHGVEVEGKKTLAKGFDVNGSMTYQTNEDSNGMDATLAPAFMAKLGVNFDAERGMSVGVFDAYFSKPTPVSDVNPSVLNVNPEPEPYHMLTAKVTMNLDELLTDPPAHHLVVSVYGNNLLNKDVYYPEINRRRINSIPLYSGRALYATLEAKFK